LNDADCLDYICCGMHTERSGRTDLLIELANKYGKCGNSDRGLENLKASVMR